mgnify:CR=1 FL=1
MAYRPTEKTEARKKAQHKLLSDTALAIVSNDGFKALTIASLAQEAGVAIGTIYKYFEDKAALCTHVFKIASGKEVEMVRRSAFPEPSSDSEKLNCTERLEQTIQSFAERAIAGHKLAYALIAEPVSPDIEAERLIYRKAYADIFEHLIEQGIDTGEFRRQDTKVAATAIVGALAETLVSPLAHIVEQNINAPDEELFSSIKKFCLNAVCKTD